MSTKAFSDRNLSPVREHVQQEVLQCCCYFYRLKTFSVTHRKCEGYLIRCKRSHHKKHMESASCSVMNHTVVEMYIESISFLLSHCVY